MSRQPLPKATEFARSLLTAHLRPGDAAIDATCGNGHDTLALVQCVGPKGFVLAIDIQIAAIESTLALLAENNCAGSVKIVHGNHADLSKLWSEHAGKHPAPRVMIFNLGYLPGAGKEIVTKEDTTLAALAQSADLLAADGLLLCTCYPGHPGGDVETSAVRAWMTSLPHGEWLVACYEMPNQPARPPVVFAAWKRGDRGVSVEDSPSR
ncbi:MAG: class I SAM-dependent methyltransferase [Verrucomicrobiales bacterium]